MSQYGIHCRGTLDGVWNMEPPRILTTILWVTLIPIPFAFRLTLCMALQTLLPAIILRFGRSVPRNVLTPPSRPRRGWTTRKHTTLNIIITATRKFYLLLLLVVVTTANATLSLAPAALPLPF